MSEQDKEPFEDLLDEDYTAQNPEADDSYDQDH